jgi:hypothetical protein
MSKKYQVYLHGEIMTTVYVEAENEDEALEEANIEVGLDNTFEYKIKELETGENKCSKKM